MAPTNDNAPRTIPKFREPDYRGFHAIGRSLGMSARMARYFANRETDPLPVYVRDGRTVVAYADEIKAWNDRRVRPRKRRARAA
jgi:hypothetical protein